jgi:hypothetical protein
MKAIGVTDQAAGAAGMTLAERPEPEAPGNGVLVRVHASGFTSGELTWPGTWTDRLDRDRDRRSPGTSGPEWSPHSATARRVCLWGSSCTAITLRQYADRKYDYAGDITVEVPYHGPGAEGAARYLQRVASLSERVPEPDLGVMMDLAECAPVTLLLQFAWSVRATSAIPDACTCRHAVGLRMPVRLGSGRVRW